MSRRIVFAALALLALERPASGGVLGRERIELRPPFIAMTRVDPFDVPPSGGPAAPATPFAAHVFDPVELDSLRGPIRLLLPERAPEGLDLEIRAGTFLFKVGAELLDPKAACILNCRLDCDTREAYFWVRLQYGITSSVYVFCESFQAAGAILGSDPTRARQGYVWDGYQVQVGGRIELVDGVTLEGGPVIYALSATRQREGVGGRVGLHFGF